MPVRFRRVEAEALQNVDAHLLLLGNDRMSLERGDQLVTSDRPAAQADVDVPGLMVDAGADELKLTLPGPEHFGDLLAAVLDAVTEADRIDLAVVDRSPGVHRHGIGVVEEGGAALRHLGDVSAEVEDHRYVALTVENAAGADRISDALIDAVSQRDADVVRVGLQSADADAADRISRAFQGFATISCRRDPRRQPVRLDHAVEQALDHRQVSLADVGQRELHVLELADRDDVADQLRGEPDASGADHADLESAHPVSPRHRWNNGPARAGRAALSRMGEFGSPRPGLMTYYRPHESRRQRGNVLIWVILCSRSWPTGRR